MSISPYFFLEKLNRQTNNWELWQPRIFTGKMPLIVVADLYPYNADHELFDIIRNRSAALPRMNGIRQEAGLYASLSDEVREEYNQMWEDMIQAGCEDDLKAPYIFTYADILIYCLSYPSVDKDGEVFPNPMIRLKHRIDCFAEVLSAFDDWKEQQSEIRVVCWFCY